MNVKKLIVGAVIMSSVSLTVKSQSHASRNIKGLWRLDKYEAFDSATGRWGDAAKRVGYFGYILYDGAGHVAVQLFPPGYKEINDSTSIDSLSIDQLRKVATMRSKCFNYFANYKILAKQHLIEHHIQSSNHPDDVGTILKRYFECRGDTLILTADEPIGGLKTRLRWVR